jgi:hypothetical protein
MWSTRFSLLSAKPFVAVTRKIDKLIVELTFCTRTLTHLQQNPSRTENDGSQKHGRTFFFPFANSAYTEYKTKVVPVFVCNTHKYHSKSKQSTCAAVFSGFQQQIRIYRRFLLFRLNWPTKAIIAVNRIIAVRLIFFW